MLKVKNLKTYFYTEEGVVPAVDGLDFDLMPNETLAIVGESGCGKSVTSLSILQIVATPPGKIIEGTIEFEGEDLLKKSEKEMRKIRGNRISMIFQEPLTSLNPVFTVSQQICDILHLHQGMSKKEARAKALEMLNKVKIPSAEAVLDEYPHQLSGGMRQRVMIAMALACNPSILIADEPTTALDVTIQAQIMHLLNDLQKDNKTSIILITHDLGVVAQIAQRVMVMYAGKAVEYASVEDIFRNPLHPYTEGLLKSIPMPTDKKDTLFSIKGNIPSPKDYPVGCRFSSRCEKCMEKCPLEEPPLVEMADGRKVRCWLYAEEAK
ncbi:MAG: ABC transporter ATP-binding protein [Candidatus Ornithospirochaeta sp.]